ncbi:uncharacterized protein L203_100984 [Cryptococcus depauperatus CBS 7841]|uniref:Uncharacterized protein n=1 Tax=Cryptococcus depauperatus CBS 7841 TaxID=1295531 RepID=A0A1E3I9I2_9TREE|nr:hypothetical protein L203_05185 [Cryptococcus depauperatus CBS 7841]
MFTITSTVSSRSINQIRNHAAHQKSFLAAITYTRIVSKRLISTTQQFKQSERLLGNVDKEKKPRNGLKVSWVFSALAGIGALVTIYGLLEYYSTLTTWPKTIRKPLRAALKCKMRGDYQKAEAFFREALEMALELGPQNLEPNPLLKISGIFAELAATLELRRQRVSAFVELRTALEMFGLEPLGRSPSSTTQPDTRLNSGSAGQWAGETYRLTEQDHIRAIGLYQKLGQLALEIAISPTAPTYASTLGGDHNLQVFGNWDDAAEHYLSNAVTAILKLGLSSPSKSATPDLPVILGRDISLPDAPVTEGVEDAGQGGQVDKRGLSITMESLSEVYARKGQHALAGQLLLQAVSLLLPPQSKEPIPMRDRCQAAMLMTTISSHALHPPSAKSLKVAESWSLRSLQLSQQALKEFENEESTDTALEAAAAVCQRAKAVGLHNLGMLAEMNKDYPAARDFFSKALTTSRQTGFAEGKREALTAMRRVQSNLDNGT